MTENTKKNCWVCYNGKSPEAYPGLFWYRCDPRFYEIEKISSSYPFHPRTFFWMVNVGHQMVFQLCYFYLQYRPLWTTFSESNKMLHSNCMPINEKYFILSNISWMENKQEAPGPSRSPEDEINKTELPKHSFMNRERTYCAEGAGEDEGILTTIIANMLLD